jgi:hypothetical protein
MDFKAKLSCRLDAATPSPQRICLQVFSSLMHENHCQTSARASIANFTRFRIYRDISRYYCIERYGSTNGIPRFRGASRTTRNKNSRRRGTHEMQPDRVRRCTFSVSAFTNCDFDRIIVSVPSVAFKGLPWMRGHARMM